MNSKPLKTILLAAFFAGGLSITACDTGQRPGEANTEDSDHVEEGSMNEGYNSDESNTDTTDMAAPYNDAEGAVHAGDGKSDGVDREDVDEKQ
ncbi:hypothetical protein [Pontibacter fetidus]|uniref:Uncharacterized protein n=1 Tax=Pontibacter fetidus TaxID=2700082 RepID=A0A6B2H195_9BACT|nr:hypothetical protein [Pontibacter fetidus]NDK56111.1 hypothetical protein [Pontibacter fetidus]